MTRRSSKKEAKSSELTLRRNARERERVKSINEAFEGLRDRLPLNRQNKKPSKHETLMGRVLILYFINLYSQFGFENKIVVI